MLTYNHERYVRQAIESILAQKTSFKFEVLVGDDASIDATASIIKEYVCGYPGIINAIFRSKNIGATKNLVDLMKRCKGKYIASCEGDDFWTDNKKLEKQVEFLEQFDDYIACCHEVLIINDAGEFAVNQNLKWISSEREYTFENFKGIYLPGHPVSLMYRNIFKEGIDPDIIESIHATIGDRTIAVLLATRGKIYRMNQRMAVYRKHDISTGMGATSHIYSRIDSYLVDYQLNDKLEAYAEQILKRKAAFRKFRWSLVLRATIKTLVYPKKDTVNILRQLYKLHWAWIKKD